MTLVPGSVGLEHDQFTTHEMDLLTVECSVIEDLSTRQPCHIHF